MNTDNLPDQAEQESVEENPLRLWTAYILEGKTRKYLGNGKGGYRMFKTLDGPDGLNTYLDLVVHPARRAEVYIQSVQAKINIPVDDDTLKMLSSSASFAPSPATSPRIPHILDSLPINIPLSTMARETLPPSASDQLREIEEKRKRRKRR